MNTPERPPAVPGEISIRLLVTSLVALLGADAFRWGDGVDAIGWQLTSARRFLFSVSTHAGELPVGRYDFQVSVAEDSLDNGEIVFLDELNVDELCDVVQRFAAGEVIER